MAVTLALALANQKIVLEKVEAISTTSVNALSAALALALLALGLRAALAMFAGPGGA